MQFTVHKKEKIYFAVMSVLSIVIYAGLCAGACYISREVLLIICGYVGFFFLLSKFAALMLWGMVKGNAIKVGEKQLPEIYANLKEHAGRLELTKVPDMYLLQGNGMLNAFAVRLFKKDFVIVFSDVMEMAYHEGADVVSFIIGHELGHIKQKHTGSFLQKLLIGPASWIPFLYNAYSRACEYTCDNIGFALSPRGASKGLLFLGAGKKLYSKICVEQLIADGEYKTGCAPFIFEIFSSHPLLLKRIEAVRQQSGEDIYLKEEYFVSPKMQEIPPSEQAEL